jgi:lipid II:glycine glycyltransferase (peptidoglycan interpeptide bridge formation enzyme)
MKVNKLLHIKDIEWAKGLGFKVYDFGGVSIGDANLEGINKFKLGFTKKIENTFNLVIPNSMMGKIALDLRSAINW